MRNEFDGRCGDEGLSAERRSAVRWAKWVTVLVCGMAMMACGSESDPEDHATPTETETTKIQCGQGTKNVDGTCIATVTTPEVTQQLVCGPGVKELDGVCVPELTPLVCGKGAIEQGGACVPEHVITCGAGTVESNGECVASVELPTMACGPGTVEQGETCVPSYTSLCGPGTTEGNGMCLPTELEPGNFTSPLVYLQKMAGTSAHMHIQEARYRESDSKLFVCSYSLSVINAKNPASMTWLAQGVTAKTPSGSPRNPGCHRLDWSDDDPDIWFTTHRKNIDFATYLSAWDNNTTCDPAKPTDCKLSLQQITPALQEPGVSYEGLDYHQGLLYVAIHTGGVAVYDFDGATFTRLGEITDGLHNAWDVIVHESGSFAVVADGLAGIATIDLTDPISPKLMAHISVGGEAGVVVLDGDIAYVAAGAAGLVVVDISDPLEPTILSTTDTPGMAVGIDYHTGKAFVACWNDTRVFDVSDPTAPKLIGATRQEVRQPYQGDTGLRPDKTARTLGVAGFGDTMFVGNWWTPYSYHVKPERKAPYILLPETMANIGFGPAEVGASKTVQLKVENHGTAPLTIYHVWATNPAFSVKSADFVVEPWGVKYLELTYTATMTDQEQAELYIFSDDPQTPVRKGWLVGNQPGLGVGVPLPETTGDLVGGGSWSYTEHGLGKVTILAYFATFCPVCGMQLPDLQAEFAEKYGDQIALVALDSEEDDDIAGVSEFVYNMGIKFPVGMETSANYDLFQANYDGANPFPTDVIIDKNGMIRYVAVEYDAVAMKAMVDMLLAE